MKKEKSNILKEVERRLGEGKDTVIDGFGTFSIYRDGCTCTVVSFKPSKDLYDRLEGKPVCPFCHSMTAELLPSQKRYICGGCLREWKTQIGGGYGKR